MYILGKAKISLLENNIEKYENSLKGRILEKQHIEQLIEDFKLNTDKRIGKNYKYFDKERKTTYYFTNVMKVTTSNVYGYKWPVILVSAERVVTITSSGIYKKTSKKGTLVLDPKNLVEMTKEDLDQEVEKEITAFYAK